MQSDQPHIDLALFRILLQMLPQLLQSRLFSGFLDCPSYLPRFYWKLIFFHSGWDRKKNYHPFPLYGLAHISNGISDLRIRIIPSASLFAKENISMTLLHIIAWHTGCFQCPSWTSHQCPFWTSQLKDRHPPPLFNK